MRTRITTLLLTLVVAWSPSGWAQETAPEAAIGEPFTHFNHGFRLGYMVMFDHDR